MINAKELRESAEWYIKGTAAIDIDPHVVIELLDERERLLEVLKKARIFIDEYEGWGGSFDHMETAVDACKDIEVPE